MGHFGCSGPSFLKKIPGVSDPPGIRKLGESCDLIITGGPLERAWQREDTHVMQAETWVFCFFPGGGGGGFVNRMNES